MKNKFISDLSGAKNLGSASHGSSHWWHQRFTAIILALAPIWFLIISKYLSLLSASNQQSKIIEFIIQNPLNISIGLIILLVSFYHAALGMQVVIEDYVHCRAARLTAIVFVQIFSIITSIAFVVTILFFVVRVFTATHSV